MSLIETISGDLQAMANGIAKAQENTTAADHAAVRIAQRAAASGFAGIAQNAARLRETITQVHASITAVGDSVTEARRPLDTAPKQPSPQETIAVLGPVADKLTTVGNGIRAATEKVTQAQQITADVLRGGQPGPMLSRLDAIKQVLAAVVQRGDVATQHVETALSEARKTGAAGK